MIRIKKATLEDLDCVTELFDLYRQFYEQHSNIERAREFLKERMIQEQSVIYIAYEESDPIGFTQLYPSFSSLSMERIWILNDLYVKKSARKKGIANTLINEAITLVTKTNAKGILLETNVENIPAQKLYEKIGFKREENIFFFLNS